MQTLHARIAATAALALCGSAQALSLSHSGSTGVVSTGTSSLSLRQFDATLGTLTGIHIALDSGMSARFVAAPAASGTSGTVSGADGRAFAANLPPTYQQIVSGGDQGSVDIGPLAAFIGPGTVSYSFIGSASDTSTASGGVLRGLQDFLYLANADITYTYDAAPVPEASTLAMLLAGLGSMGVLLRRRQA
jgi:hypothetical protein